MKKLFLLTIIFTLSFLSFSFAQEKGFGLGVILGEPTGFSAKYWTSENNALDLGLGYSFTSTNNIFYLQGDYIFHNFYLIQSTEKFVFYYGPGARFKVRENDSRLGIRGVAGILWIPTDTSFDLFMEIAPILDFVPATKIDFAGGIGARYFFN